MGPLKPECVLTRKQAHQDMQYTYGGESDTDGEGYESDLSMGCKEENFLSF